MQVQTLQKPQLIQIESSCRPYAEAGDLLELYPSQSFQGEGVYALQYVRPDRTWSGLRRVRQANGCLEIEEGSGDWAVVQGEGGSALRLMGRVERVFKSAPELVEAA